MKRSQFYEILAGLYLRLNGYFQTGYIAHSDIKGQNAAEIDILAVRFPKHRQEDRQVDCCHVLYPSDTAIELIIAEVKTAAIQFNRSIKSGPSANRTWNHLLSRTGMFDQDQTETMIPRLLDFTDRDTSCLGGIPCDSAFGSVLVKPVIFSIESAPCTQEPKRYISGNEIIEYLWLCLCPAELRDSCSTSYPLGNWGPLYQPVVKILKERNDLNLGIPSPQELHQSLLEL